MVPPATGDAGAHPEGADGSGATVEEGGAVGGGAAVEPPPLHHPLEPLPLPVATDDGHGRIHFGTTRM